MKEKNKKILKALGVGALACVGMVGLTGCANIEVSQDKVDSLIESFEQHVNKMTKEEAWNLAMTADYNFMMNVNGLRDNLVISGYDSDHELYQEMMIFYNTDEFSVCATPSGSEHRNVELWYQTTESNVVLADIQKAGTGFMCDSVEERDETQLFEDCIGVYRGACPGIGMFGFTYEDLNHYTTLENGNVSLTFVKYVTYDNSEEEYYTTLTTCTYEYSLEGKLISIDYSSRCVEATEGAEVLDTNEEMKILMSYGTVDTELVESWVEVAEEKRNEAK